MARHLPFENILIVTSEVLSPFLNLNDLGTSMLFGDGVAATLVSKSRQPKSVFSVDAEVFYTLPDTSDVLHFENVNEGLKMKGPELYRKIIPEFKKVSQQLMNSLGLSVNDFQYYLPHQANARMIERVCVSLGFTVDQMITNIESLGNTSSASMLLALAPLIDQIKPQSRILLNACGAGLTSGAAAFTRLETARL